MRTRLQVWVDQQNLRPGRALSGVVRVADMEQLRGLVGADDTEIAVTLLPVGRDSGRLGLDGRISGMLVLTCQRCLEAMDWQLDRDVAVELVATDAEAAKVHGDIEPCMLVEGRLMLREFVAEEVLLALPIAPRHEECVSRASQGAGAD